MLSTRPAAGAYLAGGCSPMYEGRLCDSLLHTRTSDLPHHMPLGYSPHTRSQLACKITRNLMDSRQILYASHDSVHSASIQSNVQVLELLERIV